MPEALQRATKAWIVSAVGHFNMLLRGRHGWMDVFFVTHECQDSLYLTLVQHYDHHTILFQYMTRKHLNRLHQTYQLFSWLSKRRFNKN